MTSWTGGNFHSTVNSVVKTIELSRSLLGQGKLNEVHNVLVEGGRKIISEMENFERDSVAVKKECVFLRDKVGKSEIEKMNRQGELLQVRKEREDLKEKVIMLGEDKRVLIDKAKRFEERYARIFQEQILMTNEKNKAIAQNNELVGILNHHMSERCNEKIASLGVKVVDTERELEDVKGKKLEADRVVVDLRRKQVEADRRIEELSRRNVEVSENMEKVRRLMVNVEIDKLKSEEELRKVKDRCCELEVKLDDVMCRNSEARGVVEELRSKSSAVEAEKQSCDLLIEEMRRKEVETDNALGEFGCKNSEAYGVIEELKNKLSAVEVEKQSCDLLIEEMRSKEVEADKALGESGHQYSEACGVIKELRDQLSALEAENRTCHVIIGEMKCKEVETDKTVQELEHKHMEASRIMRDLRSLILEANDFCQLNRSMLDVLPTAKYAEEGLLKVLKIKVEQLTDVAVKQSSSDAISPVSRDDTQISKEQSTQGLKMLGNGDSPSLSNHVIREKESEILRASGFMEVTGIDNEATPRQLAFKSDSAAISGKKRNVSEFSSDNQVATVFNSFPRKKRTRCSLGKRNGDVRSYSHNKEQIEESSHEIRDGSPRGKSSGKSGSGLVNIDQAASPSRRCEDKTSQRKASSVNSSIDGSLTDSEDESCSDSFINDFIERHRDKKLKKSWMTAAEMLNDFQKDVQHCMNAVCVLYRHNICNLESSIGSSEGFVHFNTMGGHALAEYLIDGNPENRLKKFVTEVELERPDALELCRRIAVAYCERLFCIYCNEEDLFYRSS